MAQPSMMDSCTHLHVAFDDSSEATVKRMKKEPGGVTGKSVVVLKGNDVTTRNQIVFMPNTIEMAQLKKPDKGQFKTNVQISSKMTETDIKEILVETFPFLGHQRFYCAAAVDNRTRLDFHGEPRIWDGHFIKRKIKGNSALYIFTDEELRGDCQDSKVLEQSTLKRSHDQITTQENEKSEQSVKKEMESADISKLSTGYSAYLGSEKQAKLYCVSNVSSKNIESHATEGSTVLEKSDNVLSSGAESLRQKLLHLDTIPAPKGFVYVPVATAQQGMISPVWHSSVSATHETRNAKDVSVVNVGPASLSSSIPMGTIMVPAGDAVCPGAIQRAIISTTSDQQSLGQTGFHIADGTSDARQTGLRPATHRMPQVMVSSMLTPQMTNLKISNALGSSVQLQKPVYVEKSAGKRDQSSQTVESSRDSLEHVPSLMATPQNDKNFPVELDKKAGTRPQALVELGSSDQSKQPADKKNYSGASHAAENRAICMKDATDRQCEEFAGASVSDHVSQLSDYTDSGFETSDSAGDVSLCKKTEVALAMGTTRLKQKVDKLDEAEWKENESGEEGGLSLLGSVALKIRSAVTETESAEIIPKSCSLKGGAKFLMILRERLPQDVVSGLAYFGSIAAVPLIKVNEFNMAGCVPAAPAPGVVSVKVQTLSGHYLGETSFKYIDVISDVIQLMLHDRELQAVFFGRLAKELGRKTDETDRKQPPESSSLKIADAGRPGSTKSTGSGRGICQPAELSNRLNSHLGLEDNLERLPPDLLEIAPLSDCSETERDYDSDDEASSTDSSEDGDSCPERSDFADLSSVIISCDAVPVDPLERSKIENQRSIGGAGKLCHFEKTRTSNLMEESTSVGLKSPAFSYVDNRCSEEQSCEETMFLKLLKTEDLGLKDNLETLPLGLPESAPLQACSALSYSHKRVTGSEWNRQMMNGQLNPVDSDENSESDKTQRAHFTRRRNEIDNSAAADL